MALETLKVDPDRLTSAGTNLGESARQIPKVGPIGAAALSPGSDPLSAAIAAKIPGLERPVVDELPKLAAEGNKLAANVEEAGRRYETTDKKLGDRLRKHDFDANGGRSTSAGAGGSTTRGTPSLPPRLASGPLVDPGKPGTIQAIDHRRMPRAPGGVQLPTNPYPRSDPRHQAVEDINTQLLTYGVNMTAYVNKPPPISQAEYMERYAEYSQLTADLADIVAGYKQYGIPFFVTPPPPPISLPRR